MNFKRYKGEKRRILKMKITKIISVVFILCLCFAFASCDSDSFDDVVESLGGGNRNELTTDGSNVIEGKDAAAFVALDINPSIELTLDENDVVVSVYGANDDGKLLVYNENAGIVGKEVDTAVAYITKLAVEMGYLCEDNSQVNTYVSLENGGNVDRLRNKINSKIVETAETKELSVTVDVDTAFEVLCKLEELKSLYPENAAIQNLTPGKFRLALSASADGEITVEAAAAMSDGELIAEIKNAHKVLGSHATEAYLEAKARARLIFESSVGVINDAVYTKIYLDRAKDVMSNPDYLNTIHYGAAYQAYKTAARTYRSVFELMQFADEYTNFVISEEIVAEIAAELGISDTAALRDENGNITIGSVTHFCNKFMAKNDLPDNAKAEIRKILAEVKDIAEIALMCSEEYANDFDTLRKAIAQVLSAVSNASVTLLPLLPVEAKAELEACLEYLKDTGKKINEIMQSGDTSDTIIALAQDAEKRAAEILTKIESDLTKEEKARVEAYLEANRTQVDALTKGFMKSLENAEKAALDRLANKKAERNPDNNGGSAGNKDESDNRYENGDIIGDDGRLPSTNKPENDGNLSGKDEISNEGTTSDKESFETEKDTAGDRVDTDEEVFDRVETGNQGSTSIGGFDSCLDGNDYIVNRP